jgi:hypothetical protein
MLGVPSVHGLLFDCLGALALAIRRPALAVLLGRAPVSLRRGKASAHLCATAERVLVRLTSRAFTPSELLYYLRRRSDLRCALRQVESPRPPCFELQSRHAGKLPLALSRNLQRTLQRRQGILGASDAPLGETELAPLQLRARGPEDAESFEGILERQGSFK